METHHEYRVKVFSAGARKGVVSVEGVLPSMSFSAPPEFLGEVGRWTPEHFLVAALGSCFVSTFSSIAEKSRFKFDFFQVQAEGMLDHEDGVWQFTEIRLLPVVSILDQGDYDRAVALLEKAEKSCLIARSLRCKVTLFPTVRIEEQLLAPPRV